ncbi:hypothetical protein [Mangrovihabitans endophyticus]|uniref:Uncharacterized protein n=1 Tax=Mangrovihabitans endophyticus TaxID=1751298 RepID=A0A8J3FLL6_9ACTN|nr:hypothetical protein [Mangrovihabitans endophyticus]GGK73279.1 hypothetical protein GCM10012284_03950 [Mangrovihabitans endophyticus]
MPFDASVCLRELPDHTGSPIADAMAFGADAGIPVVVAGSGDDPRPRAPTPGPQPITRQHPIGMLGGARRIVVWLDREADRRYEASMIRPESRLGRGPSLFRGARGADPDEAARRYDELVKRVLTPGLRAMGFASSGRTYRLTAATDDFAQVGVQRIGSFPDSIRFTLAFSLISVKHWENYRAQSGQTRTRPKAVMPYGWGEWGRCWWARANEFMASVRAAHRNHDEGFLVSAREPVDPVGEEALTVVREFGLPFLLAQIAEPI